MRFYPNQAQWAVLWCVLPVAALIVAPDLFTDFAGFHGDGRWTFPDSVSEHRALLIALVLTSAALLCWRWAAKPPALKPSLAVMGVVALSLSLVYVVSNAFAARGRNERVTALRAFVLADPDFRALPEAEQLKGLREIDPKFRRCR